MQTLPVCRAVLGMVDAEEAVGSGPCLLMLTGLLESLGIIYRSHYFSCVKSTEERKGMSGKLPFFTCPLSLFEGLCEQLSLQGESQQPAVTWGQSLPAHFPISLSHSLLGICLYNFS